MTLDEIKHLIEFIRAQDLSEFELEQDGMKIRIKSGAAATALPMVPACSPDRANLRVRTPERNASANCTSCTAGARIT